MSAQPAAKMAATTYVSIKDEIVRKALNGGMSLDIVNGRVNHFQKVLSKHYPINSAIVEGEACWLLELLVWDSLFSDQPFPGIKPSGVLRLKPVPREFLAPCQACGDQYHNLKSPYCPYVLTAGCRHAQNAKAGLFVRLGCESLHGAPACAKCGKQDGSDMGEWVHVEAEVENWELV